MRAIVVRCRYGEATIMDRGQRRNIERKIRKMIRQSGDNCTICGRPYKHNSRTVGGLTADGEVALAGECCADKIVHGVTAGVFTNRNHDDLIALRGKRMGGTESSSEDIGRALDSLQEGIANRDRFASDLRRRAGIQSDSGQLHLGESLWKSDDAAWFSANPTRSHRLRPLIANEGGTIARIYFDSLPPDHEVQIVVRQIEPGKRIRAPFGRNMAIPIPDNEEIIHAIFDMIFKTDRKQDVIGIREVAERANKYAASKAEGSSGN